MQAPGVASEVLSTLASVLGLSRPDLAGLQPNGRGCVEVRDACVLISMTAVIPAVLVIGAEVSGIPSGTLCVTTLTSLCAYLCTSHWDG